MKNWNLLIVVLAFFCLNACTDSTQSKAENAVKKYLEDNLNNPDSYCPRSFSNVIVVKKGSTLFYSITHVYTLLNSDKNLVKMTVPFMLYDDFTVQEKELLTINGDYGLLEIIEH